MMEVRHGEPVERLARVENAEWWRQRMLAPKETSGTGAPR
jgi:hypothetical protein